MVHFHRFGGDSAWYILFFSLFACQHCWAKTIATTDSWSSSLQKTSIKNKARFLSTCHFQLAVMCLRWVEMWLCCEPWVLPVCFQAHTKTPTVYQNCTSQDHRYHTYSISRAQPSMLCVSFLLPGGEPPQPSEGSQSRLIQTDRHMSWGRHGCLSDTARSAEEDSTQFLKVSAHFISYETFLKNWMLKNIM